MWTKRLLFLVLAAASISFASAQIISWKRIKGNGKVQTEERRIGQFDRLIVKGSMDVNIQQSTSGQALTIEAESNILPLVETVVEGGTLVIKMKPSLSISINKGVPNCQKQSYTEAVILHLPEDSVCDLLGSNSPEAVTSLLPMPR